MKLWEDSILCIAFIVVGALSFWSGVWNEKKSCIACRQELAQTQQDLDELLSNQIQFNDELIDSFNSAHEKVVAEAVEK